MLELDSHSELMWSGMGASAQEVCVCVCVSGKDVNVNALKLSEENWSDLFSSFKHVNNAINNSTNFKKKNQQNYVEWGNYQKWESLVSIFGPWQNWRKTQLASEHFGVSSWFHQDSRCYVATNAVWQRALKKHTAVSEWSRRSADFSSRRTGENPIVLAPSPNTPPPPPPRLSACLWRSAGFRKRDGEMFPVAGLSAAD